MSFFVTGTDTGVGKIYLIVQLLRLLRARGLYCAAMKPIYCGDRRDAELLLAARSEGLTIDEINPLWLRTPAAPFAASLVEHVDVEIEFLLDHFEKMNRRFDFLLIEGVSGWMVPITKNYFVSDLAVAMKLLVLVVAQNKLGCLNHTLLTLQSIESNGAKRGCGLKSSRWRYRLCIRDQCRCLEENCRHSDSPDAERERAGFAG